MANIYFFYFSRTMSKWKNNDLGNKKQEENTKKVATYESRLLKPGMG